MTDISFSLDVGEAVGLAGRSGAGKSTLLLTLAGVIPGSIPGEHAGQVLFRDADLSLRSGSGFFGQAAIVFQDPESQFLGLTVEEEISFPLENAGLRDPEIEGRIAEYLDKVGLPGFEKRSPLTLSGGEKQRVAIAIALAMETSLLLLDEPTAELDAEGSRTVSVLIRQICKERCCAVVIASHDVAALASTCSRILVLDRGRIVANDVPVSLLRRGEDLLRWGIRAPSHSHLSCILKGARLAPPHLLLTVESAKAAPRECLAPGASKWRASS
ncbi:MAG: energy-coupling factor ABC transporter ATP-binding protein [Bacillota bacterium]